MINTIECVIPDFILPYLINGDSSNLNEEEIAIINQWYDKNFSQYIGHWGNVPEYSDDFRKYHDLTSYGILATNCAVVDFVIMRAL